MSCIQQSRVSLERPVEGGKHFDIRRQQMPHDCNSEDWRIAESRASLGIFRIVQPARGCFRNRLRFSLCPAKWYVSLETIAAFLPAFLLQKPPISPRTDH